MDKDIRSAIIVVGCGLVGIIFAVIEKTLYDKGVLIDEFITGSITLPDLMAFTIIFWLIVGVVLGVISR